ncbi:MAG TPA: hypothetical protein VFJ21_05885 [Mycobacteriales bacterium]|nr:hypothetical protein [Mycobacteriales bacterium]
MNGCTATRHGNEDAYVNYGCRCLTARADHARRSRTRQLDARNGTPATVDADEGQRLLRELQAAGLSYRDIGEHLGITASGVYRMFKRSQMYRSTLARIVDVHALLLPLPAVDEVAVQRALAGEHVSLPRDERGEALVRLIAAGLTPSEAGRRLRLSGASTRALLDEAS